MSSDVAGEVDENKGMGPQRWGVYIFEDVLHREKPLYRMAMVVDIGSMARRVRPRDEARPA